MNSKATLKGVSVVIPTINRAEVLVDSVKDILRQDFDEFELIVVDQSDEVNEDVLRLLRSSDVPSRYFKALFRGVAQARNFGWQQARHDVVLYIDDDIRTNDGLVRSHYAAHVRSGAAMVAGGIDEAKGDSPSDAATGSFNWWTASPTRNFCAHRAAWCLHAPGGNFSIRREVVAAVGGADELLSVGAALYEETELALRINRAGYRIWFEPDARLTHLAAPTGGNRVLNDWPRYMYGLSHNRSIVIFRYLRPWHRPTAVVRLLLLGVSYCRVDRSLRPFFSTLRGLNAGRRAAPRPPLNTSLQARECTSC
jgi:glycosyltransferase involved in cell wall biosynthesis